MKIRTGFVSNSSSSSFCIMGIMMEKNKDNKNFMTALPSMDNINWHYINNDYEDVCIGLNMEEMGETETLHEFKLRVQKVLSDEGLKIPIGQIYLSYGEFFDG
jgi:hypothetical protein